MLTTGEDDSADDDVYDSKVYLIEDGNTDDGSDAIKDAIFFSVTEVLLDNQAGRSIFKNRPLLHNTSAVGPFYIGGIDSTSRGLRISNLVRVACETADAIFGSSIPAMKGKTHKKASTPASAVIASRVTQVQQMLAVDLLYVKKILFLLGEMVPLGLALCTPVKNRTATVVAAGI